MGRSFSLLALLVTLPVWGGSYNMADLKALAQEGSHQEFLAHALDIRPSERDEEWKTLVTRMGRGLADEVLKDRPVVPKNFHRIEELYRWPALRSDDVFKSRRMEIGLAHLKVCLLGQTPCWRDLEAFWKEDSSDPDVAVKLAEIVQDRTDAPYKLWTLLERPLQTPFAEFYCKKPFVLKALWEKLELDYLKLTKSARLLSRIEETIHADCLPSLVKEARRRLRVPDSEIDRELSFEILNSTGQGDSSLKDFFFTVYLLEHPGQGELMNLAWNNLSELGKSAERREEVLSEIRKLDPLPDAILGSLDLLKRRAVLRHFKTNFPEFFDFYSHQCLDYYSGAQKFSKGNPTMRCQDLMDSELATELLPASKIDQFKRAKKI